MEPHKQVLVRIILIERKKEVIVAVQIDDIEVTTGAAKGARKASVAHWLSEA
jgi:hypothetical protein